MRTGKLKTARIGLAMTNKHGGPGRGQGRKPLADGEQTVMFALRMTVSQRKKLAQLGGAEWLRSKIDKAKAPNLEFTGFGRAQEKR